MFSPDDAYKLYDEFNFKTSKEEAIKILNHDEISDVEYLKLLNCDDLDVLEIAARRAKEMTERYFGKNIFLYVPLYISNICSSGCLYCG